MTNVISNMVIRDAIECICDAKHKAYLEQFSDQHKDSTLRVTETDSSFEITASHPSSESASGGAEQFLIDKDTGDVSMAWHEHPVSFGDIVVTKSPNPDTP